MASPISRDDAVQMLYNALLATPMMVVPDGRDENGQVAWSFKPASRKDGSPVTLLSERFDLEPADILD